MRHQLSRQSTRLLIELSQVRALYDAPFLYKRERGGIGRRTRLRIWRLRRVGSSPSSRTIFFTAKVAQLVEYNLAKVEVAGSKPVFRSKMLMDYQLSWQSNRLLIGRSQVRTLYNPPLKIKSITYSWFQKYNNKQKT